MVDNELIFQKGFSQIFITALANSDTESIFEVESIKVAIKMIWKHYFRKIMYFVFLPQLAYFITFLIYSTFVYNENTYNKEAGNRK